MKYSRKYRLLSLLLVFSLMVTLLPANQVVAAAHVHTSDCYTGTLHTHDSNCDEWGSVAVKCYKCNGTGQGACRYCNNEGIIYLDRTCDGVLGPLLQETTSSSQPCTECGAYSSSTSYYYICSGCGDRISSHGYGQCGCGGGGGGSDYYNTLGEGVKHSSVSKPCNSHSYGNCTECNGEKFITRTCDWCGGNWINANCIYCESGIYKKSVDSSKCTLENMEVELIDTEESSSQYHNSSTGVYEYRCLNCKSFIIVRHTTGSSVGGPINSHSITSMSGDNIPWSNDYDTNEELFSVLEHFSTGGKCLYCGGDDAADCTSCISGKQYLSSKCPLDDTKYYDASGNECQPICSQVVTSIAPSKTSQTINVGDTPNWNAVVTFLDGSTKNVSCNVSGYSSTTYGSEQTVTLSYGSYNGSAKNPGAKTVSAKITINGYFNLSVSSEDTSKGTVTGGGSKLANSSVTVSATPKAGYSFVGWYDGTTKVSGSSSYTFTMPASAKTLTAKFSVNNYTLTATSDNTAMGSVSGSSGSITYGSSVTVKALANPGYNFVGWYEGSTKVSSNASYQFTMPASNKTLTAKFSTASYNVIFDSAGGTECSSKSVSYNSVYGTLPTPTKVGHTFLGWYIDSTKIESDTIMDKTASHTLTAKWSVNSYTLTIMDIDGNRQEEFTHYYGAQATIDAGTKPASWFTGWTVVLGDGSAIDLSSDCVEFSMPAGNLVLKANWNDVVSITSEFNQELYNSYSGVYDSTMDSFDIDKTISNKLLINKSMLDVYVVFEDGTTKLITSPEDFDITGNEISTVGSSNIKVVLNTIEKQDGSKFECSSVLKVHSASIDNVMSDLGLSTYKDLANYISGIEGDYQSALNDIAEYSSALESYKELLNSVDGNNISLDGNITSDIGRIEVGIQTALDNISQYESDISLIQNALVNAGEGLGPEFDISDGELSTILTQIQALKINIDTLQSECSSLTEFCNDLRELLGLDESSSINDIYNSVSKLKTDLESAENAISDYKSTISAVNETIYGNIYNGDESSILEDAINGLKDVDLQLDNINSEINILVDNLAPWLNNQPSTIVNNAESINSELLYMQENVSNLTKAVNETVTFAEKLKVMLGLDEGSTFQDIIEEVGNIKSQLEIAQGEISAYESSVNGILSDMYDNVDDSISLHDKLSQITTGVDASKLKIKDYNSQVIALINKLNSIESGTLTDSEEYVLSSLDTELSDMSQYIAELSTNVDDTLNLISSLKYLLDMGDDSTASDILSKVQEHKNRMEDAEEKVSMYETTLEEVFDKLGTEGDSEDLSDYLNDALEGLDSVKVTINGIDVEVHTMIDELIPVLDKGDQHVSAVSGSAIEVVVKDLESDVNTLKNYLGEVLDFADEVIKLFNIKSDDGDISLNDIILNLQNVKQEYDLYSDTISRLQTLISSGSIEESDLSQRLSELYSEIDALKDKLDSTDSMLESEFGESQDIETIKQSIQELKSQLSNSLGTIEELKSNNVSKDIIIEEQKSKISELQADIDSKNAIIQSKDETIENLIAQIESLKKSSSSSNSAVIDLTTKVEEYKEKVVKLESNETTLKKQITELESKVSLKEEEVIELQNDNKSLSEDITNSNKLLEEQAAELDRLSKDAEAVSSLKETVNSLEKDLLLSNSQVEDLSSQVKILEEKLNSDSMKDSNVVERLESEVTALSNSNSKLEINIKALEQSLQESKQKNRELLMELTKAKNTTVNKDSSDEEETYERQIVSANEYSHIYLADSMDIFTDIKDKASEGNRVIFIDSWNTSDGLLLSRDGYMLSFFTDYAWTNCLDVMQNKRTPDDTPKVLNDVMLYEIDMSTGEFVTFFISNVYYNP